MLPLVLTEIRVMVYQTRTEGHAAYEEHDYSSCRFCHWGRSSILFCSASSQYHLKGIVDVMVYGPPVKKFVTGNGRGLKKIPLDVVREIYTKERLPSESA